MKVVDSATHTPMTKPGASSSFKNNVKPKWLFGIVLFGMLAKLWPFNANNNLESYLVCSETKNIYTVDESRPRVECISVRGSRIVDSGNFGMFASFFDSAKCRAETVK